MRTVAWGPVAAAMLLLGIGGVDAWAARCTDDAAVATARTRIAATCACGGTRAAYRRCLATTIAGLSGTLAPPCAAAARRCAAASTCGRPGAVTCCTQRNGRSRCRIRRTATACTSHGGTVKACPSCCDACGTSCLGETVTTSTIPLLPCEETAFPVCAGGCAAGLVCQAMAATGSLDLRFCQCVPDDIACSTAPGGMSCTVGRCAPGEVCTGVLQGSSAECTCATLPPPATTTTSTTIPGQLCGDTAYPTCGGVCPTGDVCQAMLWSGLQTRAFCQCVPGTGTCATVSGGTACTVGPCPAGTVCDSFTFASGVECGCIAASTTTTTPGGTTTTSSTVAPRGPCAPGDCAGGCTPDQVCQAIWVTGPATFNLCLCLDANSSCDGANGTCPGACPAGRTCGDQFAGGVHTACGCLP